MLNPADDHNSMANMYMAIPPEYVSKHKLGSVYYLLPGLATINTILRYTLMPKSGDDRMIRGYSIDMLHHIDGCTNFNVMDLIVETVKRTAADQKRSCGYAPYIQMLINSKVGNNVYLLDRKHLPLQPELEDCTVTMDASHPSSAVAQEQAEAARATAQTSRPSTSTAELPKTKNDQMTYLLLATQRIEQGLANLVKNQESLERIVETKFHDLDVKVTEMATDLEKLKADVEAKLSDDDDDVLPLPLSSRPSPDQPLLLFLQLHLPQLLHLLLFHRQCLHLQSSRHHRKHLQTDSSPLHRPTPVLPVRGLHRQPPWIEPRATFSSRSFDLFGNLLPKGESDIDH